MSSIRIKAEAKPGVRVETAISDAIEFARKYEVGVLLLFNTVELIISKDSDVDSKIELYHKLL